MPPQLLSFVRPIKHVDFSAEAFAQRASVARAAAQCISSWSHVELATGRLFLSMLGGNPVLGAEIFNAFDSGKAKTNAIRTLALSSLNKDDYQLVTALLSLIKRHQKTRDKIAHWIWGYSKDIEGSMLLADPKTIMAHYANIKEIHSGALLSGFLSPSLSPDEIYVYSEKSLASDSDEFEKLANLIGIFRAFISVINSEAASHIRVMINTDARLVEFLSQKQTVDQ